MVAEVRGISSFGRGLYRDFGMVAKRFLTMHIDYDDLAVTTGTSFTAQMAKTV